MNVKTSQEKTVFYSLVQIALDFQIVKLKFRKRVGKFVQLYVHLLCISYELAL